MKKLWLLMLVLVLAMPYYAFAYEESGEVEVMEIDVETGQEIQKQKPTESDDLAYDRTKAGYPKKPAYEAQPEYDAQETETKYEYRPSSTTFSGDRKGHFRFGLIGPGYAIANKGAGSMMSMGLEGEYFFWDKLSAVMRIEVATDFDDIAILSFVPRARYVFDLDSHPRWSIYVQGGVGVALWNGDKLAADIAIPGGGFWWQWTDNWSVGADASMHILVRSNTAIGFTIGPAIRYQF